MKRSNLGNRPLVNVLAVIGILMFCIPLFSQFSGGTGTENDPWRIANVNDLNAIRNYLGETHSDKHYVQTANINLTAVENWVPIGSAAGRFFGSYNGIHNNTRYTISNLQINRPETDYIGLFGYIQNALLKNISIISGTITGNDYVGSITGYSAGEGTVIDNCYARSAITANAYTGGLAGYIFAGTISNCYAAGNVTAEGSYAGGLIGYNRGIVRMSYATGNVTGDRSVGGLIGYKGYGVNLLTNSYAAGSVTGNINVGGLLGFNYDGNVANSYSSGAITGANSVGGLIGRNRTGTITNCYWNTETSGKAVSAGGAGKTTAQMIQQVTFQPEGEPQNHWDFANVWNIGHGQNDTYPYLRWQGEPGTHNLVTGQHLPPSNLRVNVQNTTAALTWTAPSIGNPVSYRVYRNNNVIANVQASPHNDQNLQMNTLYTYYVTAMYEGNNESARSNSVNVIIDRGNGSQENPWQIETLADLNSIRDYLGIANANQHFIQTANINLADVENWVPIGTSAAASRFFGSYNGNGFTIANLTINTATTYQGLFAYAEGARFSNIKLTNLSIRGGQFTAGLAGFIGGNSSVHNVHIAGTITGTSSYFAGITGYLNNGTISNSSFSGSLTGAGSYGGGLVGLSTPGSISNCFVAANITGTGTFVGGLVGDSRTTPITNSYYIGSVTGTQYVGGITGRNQNASSIITNCYVSSSVSGTTFTAPICGENGGTVNNSYWNRDLTNIQSPHGTPRTTSQLVQQNNFAGWNFEEVWGIGVAGDNTYPWLRWQNGAGEHNFPLPLPPQNLTGTAGNAQVVLNWQAPEVGNPTEYRIHRNNEFLAAVNAPTMTYTDNNVNNHTQYNFYVTAVTGGEESPSSNAADVTPVEGGFAGGNGTPNTPYLVATPAQLTAVRYNLHSHYRQTENISIAGFANWTPIGNSGTLTRFFGSYDGNGFAITNLTINTTGSYQGLFGYTQDAVLKNITLSGVNVRGGQYTAGLVSFALNSTITNCKVYGSVTGTSSYFAGFAGYLNNSTVTGCASFTTVTGTNHYTGGFTSYQAGGTIQSSFAVGSVTTTASYAGGFAGYSNSIINDCYSAVTVSGLSFTGGFIGQSAANITNCYSLGRADGQGTNIGGFAGQRSSQTIAGSYWNTQTSGMLISDGGTGRTVAQMTQPGTFAGWSFPQTWTINQGQSYPYLTWQGEAAEHNLPPALLPPSNLTVLTADRRVNLSWQAPDFGDVQGYRVYRNGVLINAQNLIPNTNYQDINLTNYVSYTYYVTAVSPNNLETDGTVSLTAVPFPGFAGGTGTAENPYQIATAEQLNYVRIADSQRLLSRSFILTADIDLNIPPFNTDQGWVPIGTTDVLTRFTGTFNGDGYVIANLFINRTSTYQGLFAYADGATIVNVSLTNANLTTGGYSGVLAGYTNYCVIENSGATGRIVSTTSYLGGLVGTTNYGRIDRSFSGVNVSGASYLGGITGRNTYTNLTNCYAAGAIIGTSSYVGGLVGNSFGDINFCYAVSRVQSNTPSNVGALIGGRSTGTIAANNYWNSETSGQETGGTGAPVNLGRTTAQMVTAENYENWAFGNVWDIDDGVSFPYLQWQEFPGIHNLPVPANLTATSDDGIITLQWTAPYRSGAANNRRRLEYSTGRSAFNNNERNLQGYNLYKNGVLINQNQLITNVRYDDTDVENFVPFTYYVTAVYDDGESAPSNSVETAAYPDPLFPGSGTVQDPWQVYSAGQLSFIRFYLDAHFIQTAHINLGVAPWNSGAGWVPLGNSTANERFTGSYNGNGFTISGLRINRPEQHYQGLFGYVQNGALRNMTLTAVNVTGNQFTGGLIGYQHQTAVHNCSAAGTVTGTTYTGGLIGYQRYGTAENSSITESHSAANVSGTNYVGGLVGDNWDANIIASSSSGNVSGNQFVGGITGYARGNVIDSYTSGTISGTGSYVAGLVAYHTGLITGCRTTGRTISTSGYVGGLTGFSGNTVSSSHTTGYVQGNRYVGGLTGWTNNDVTISNCYSSANVFNTNAETGGLVGYSRGIITGCYAAGSVEGLNFTGGLVGYKRYGNTNSVINSYASGNVISNGSTTGGLVGYNYQGDITNSYSSSTLSGNPASMGGLTGGQLAGATTVNSYWNTETSGMANSASGEGRTTLQMLQRNNYEPGAPNNWDFNNVWNIVNGQTYPYHRWQQNPAGHNRPSPMDLAATPGNRRVILNWNPPPALEPESYRVYRNYELVNETFAVTDTTFTDSLLVNYYNYVYYVTAMYQNEVESGASNYASVIPVEGGFAGGDGSALDPYQINSAGALYEMRFHLGPDNFNVHFIQTANIDLDTEPFNQEEGWQPIGTEQMADRFNGSFNGNGFTISGLTINRPLLNYAGLFAYLNNADIKNVKLTDVNITGNSYTAGLAGFVTNSAIVNCHLTGEINARGNYSGGITGYNSGANISISNSSFNGIISGINYIGGIAGFTTGTANAILRSYAAGRITGTGSYIGGLVGQTGTTGSIMTDCYSAAAVNGANFIGGLIGDSRSNITSSYAVGKVTGTGFNTGPLAGRTDATATINVNSYWNAETTGMTSYPGNVFGGTLRRTGQMIEQDNYQEWNFNTIWAMTQNGYPYLRWQNQPQPFNSPGMIPPYMVTAVAGHSQITLYWEAPSLGQPEAYRIFRNNVPIALFEGDELAHNDTGLNNNTAYTYHLTAIYGDDVESQPSNSFQVTPVQGGYAGGRGTVQQPYQIATAAQLDAVRHNNYAHYVQTADIDLAAYTNNWNPIGTSGATARFFGTYNGNNHTISNLTRTTATTYSGLFGYTEMAVLKNVSLTDVNLAVSQYSGSLAGMTQTTIVENCNATGQINGSSTYIGGLTGSSINSQIDRCYTDVTIISNSAYVGGLTATNSGTPISNSYAKGNITSTNASTTLYVGGFIGYNYNIINNCFAKGNIVTPNETGGYVGGFAGRSSGTISDSYARGTVTANRFAGGFIGYNQAPVVNCFATGRLSAAGQDVGGLNGWNNSNITASYWDTQSTGIQVSAGGDGRTTEQMTFPYAADTFVNWDFNEIWEADELRVINNGYPFLRWYEVPVSPNPTAAIDPAPAHQARGVAVNLQNVRWSYESDPLFTDPAGFRVYMNTTGIFQPTAPFVWVTYVANQEQYTTAEVLPQPLLNGTIYYWKVVPTTELPDNRSENRKRQNSDLVTRYSQLTSRGDAEDVQVWSFTTVRENPTPASNPQPQHQATDIPVELENLRWSYTVNPAYSNPLGFRVYLNTTGEFEEQDDFDWVPYIANQTQYASTEILPDFLDFETTYYWKVVPTTNAPGRDEQPRNRQAQLSGQRSGSLVRGDAQNVPVWSFTTRVVDPHPVIATNPQPQHLASGVSPRITRLSWDYVVNPAHSNPLGFRVYLNETGSFGTNAPFVWVDYSEGTATYHCTEIITGELDEFRTYYWRIVPTTNHPDDERGSDARTKQANLAQRNVAGNIAASRGDAENVPTWRFTTGEVSAEDIEQLPDTSRLESNYPNPFNPDTRIGFSIAEAGNVCIEVYNTQGRRIATLHNGYLQAGQHSVVWNGNDENHNPVGSGLYFYRLTGEGFVLTRKMTLIK